jgi:hypothetical protein
MEAPTTFDDYLGAALWLPPDVHPDEDVLVTLLKRTVTEQIQKMYLRYSNKWAAITRASRIGICPSLVSPSPTGQRIWLGANAARPSSVRSRPRAGVPRVDQFGEHSTL